MTADEAYRQRLADAVQAPSSREVAAFKKLEADFDELLARIRAGEESQPTAVFVIDSISAKGDGDAPIRSDSGEL